MDIHPITPDYAVSPQISAEDLTAIAEAGFATVICNRPDSENGPDLQSAVMRSAAEVAGLRYEVLALDQQTLNPDNAARQRAMIEASDGPVLAYCRSGTRCSVIWALGQVGTISTDEILSKTSAAGYQLDNLRPALDQLAAQSR